MSLLSRLFGGGSSGPSAPQGEDYNGFTIYPEPIAEGKTNRIAARIEKQVGDELKVHQLIRADTIEDREEAVKASANKAKQMIDQLGDRVFD